MKIYRNAIEIYDLTIDDKTQLSQKLMGEDLINLSVVTDQTLDLQVGDYTLLDGATYEINRPAKFRKISAAETRYDVQLEGMVYRMLNKIVLLNGRSDFYLTGTLEDFVDLIVANLNTIDTGWAKGTVMTTDWKNIYIKGLNTKQLLDQLAGYFVAEYQVVGKTISVVERVEQATALTFELGKNKGLYELTRESVDSENTVTRAYFFGSTRNLDYTYRDGEDRLVFVTVEGKKYLENTTEYPKIVEKNVIFEDIYPRFTGLVDAVSTDKKTITAANIDFDLNEQLIAGVKRKCVFLSGDLMGLQFEVSAFNNDTKQVTLVPINQDNGVTYPSTDYAAAIGDTFTFIDITMPSSYIVNAENTLYDLAVKWLDHYSQLRVKYTLVLDARYVRDNAISLSVGDVVNVVDSALGINKEIRITALVRSLDDDESTFTVEISNYREETREKELQAALSDTIQQLIEARSAANAANMSITNLNEYLSTYTPSFDNITGLPTDNDALREYLERIGDTSYIDTETKLISGAVLWKEGLKYESTDFIYKIFGVPLKAFALDEIYLADADPNLSRIDAFYLDSFGNFGVKTGTPALNPVSPILAVNELLVATVLIAPGALEPTDIDIDKIYDENIEWATSVLSDAGNTTVTAVATDKPVTGSKHIKMSIAVPDEEVSYPLHYLGEPYQGGKIFWMEPGTNGKKGKIAATNDTVTGVYWAGLSGHSAYGTGGRGIEFGDGKPNTAAMMALAAANHDVAKYVTDLIIDGYSDFYLGSQKEMVMLWNRRYLVGNFNPAADYWTSSEYAWNEAVRIDWQTGGVAKRKKDTRRNARAIRDYDDTQLPSGVPVEFYTPTSTNILFSAGAAVPITDGIISLKMSSSKPWRANSMILFELFLDNVRTGSVAMSPATNLFGYKPDQDDWQLVALQLFNFVPTKTTFDAVKISLTGSWPNNMELNIDDVRFQYSNVTAENDPVVQVPNLTLLADAWVLVGGIWQYQFDHGKIKADSIVDIIPKNDYAAIVNAAGIYPETISSEGSVYLFAVNKPTGDIGITLTITEATL